MRVLGKIACLTLAACSASIAGPANAATQFNFQFDNAGLFDNEGMPVHDGTLDQPIVGTGTFISPIDLAPGTYDLTSLSGFSVTFSFTNGDTFSTSDISTPLTGVSVFITDLGGGAERLFFVESGGAGSDGGPHFGALDLDSGSTFLSFAPSSFGNFLYQESGDSGRYHALGSAVPEPTTWAMMLIGFAAIGFSLRRARTASSNRLTRQCAISCPDCVVVSRRPTLEHRAATIASNQTLHFPGTGVQIIL